MAPKESLIEDLDNVTEKLSTKVWTLNLGTLGTIWALLITTNLPNNIHIDVRDAAWVLILCFFSLVCDMGQYFSAYKMDKTIFGGHGSEQSNYISI
jgi:hypothetical protein